VYAVEHRFAKDAVGDQQTDAGDDHGAAREEHGHVAVERRWVVAVAARVVVSPVPARSEK